MDEVGVRMWERVRDARGKQGVLVESNIPAISVLGGNLDSGFVLALSWKWACDDDDALLEWFTN
jgi:hypothetical protein